ncbi:ABC transporter ATP-binding protein [Pseudostreptobacillus sp.]
MNIFKYMKKYIFFIFLIVIIYIFRAYSELQLPGYTSNLINTGIQQNGIENSISNIYSKETYEKLKQFMTDDEITILNNSYELKDNRYEVKKLSKDEINRLNPILEDISTTISFLDKFNVNSNNLDKKSALSQRELVMKKLSKNADMYKKTIGANFVKTEYEKNNINIDKIRNKYILSIGYKMLVYTLIGAISSILGSFIASFIASKIGSNLRNSLYKKILNFSKEDMSNFSTASLITRSTNDIQQIQLTTNMILILAIYSPIMAFIGINKILNINSNMSWIVALSIGVLLMVIAILITLVLPKFKISQKLIDKINLISRELITGVPVIRVFTRENYEENRFNIENIKLYNNQVFINRTISIFFPAIMIIMNATSIIISWFGAKKIDLGVLQVGDLIAFISYAMFIIMSFLLLVMVMMMFPRALVASNRVEEVLNQEITISDSNNPVNIDTKNIKGKLEFKNVNFYFKDAQELVLKNISFTVNSGETVAIIGSTGSGKSTIINLIERFFDTKEGEILIDDINIKDMKLEDLRNILGYIPQKGSLFKGNISSNIKYDNTYISDESMIKAADISQSLSFISEKEKGFESDVSQGGNNLSGGQKQRISIARALAKNPKIVLFDDSFSALDPKTDLIIRNKIKENMKDSTKIIVAQRISTILDADKIIVLDEGEIIGIGKHEELIKNCDTYIQIAKSQLNIGEVD